MFDYSLKKGIGRFLLALNINPIHIISVRYKLEFGSVVEHPIKGIGVHVLFAGVALGIPIIYARQTDLVVAEAHNLELKEGIAMTFEFRIEKSGIL